jgi:isoleucyl-tRNA synthetase
MTRDKSNSEDEEDKRTVLSVIYHSLLATVRIMSPLCPFITEQIYRNLKAEFGLSEESIHSFEWMKADEKLIDKELEQEFETVKTVIQSMLSAREKVQLGVRWPLSEVIVVTTDADAKKGIMQLAELIKTQTNVKKLSVVENFDKVKLSVKADYTKIGPAFGEKSPQVIAQMSTTSPEAILSKIEKEGKFVLDVNGEKLELTKDHLIVKRELPDLYAEGEFGSGFVYLDKTRTAELEAEGYARELMRRVQALRKDAKLSKPDRISLFIQTDQEMVAMLKPWNDAIKEKVGAKQMNITHNEPAKMHEHKKKEKIKEKEFVVEFDKL